MNRTCEDALALFQRCITSGVVEYWQKQARMKIRCCIYSAQVVIWLMILQRLQPRGTLATGVEALVAGAADGLLSDCGRVRRKRASRHTGTSLELEASPRLQKAYPPAENQHGRAHWPVLRLLVLHELETGLAEEPHWGPMYGSQAVSEQQLAEKAGM